MSHPAGERLRCDECGAELLLVKACPCPEREPKAHSGLCCGKEMRRIGIDTEASVRAQSGYEAGASRQATS
jgi:hypothetical protein